MSVLLSAPNNSASTGRIFIKFYIWKPFENPSRKFKYRSQQGTLHDDEYTFLIISRSVLLRMRNVSDKSCTEQQNTHIVFNNFSPQSCSVYEKMWKNMV
jgi:hypothetical protein